MVIHFECSMSVCMCKSVLFCKTFFTILTLKLLNTLYTVSYILYINMVLRHHGCVCMYEQYKCTYSILKMYI